MSLANTRRTAQLVLAAIADLKNVRGSSVDGIVDHITREYDLPEADFRRYVPGAIEKGVAFGAIERKRGRLFLGEVMDKIREHRRRRKSKKGGHHGKGRRRSRKRHH